MDIATVLKAGTPVYATDPGKRPVRHVGTIARPMRDYGRNTASYYEVKLHNGRVHVFSADYIELRAEGKDAMEWNRG